MSRIFDIVIVGGNSNSEGGLGQTSLSTDRNENIFYLNTDLSIGKAYEKSEQGNNNGNFYRSFCLEYIKRGYLAPEKDMLIVRAGEGGAGFANQRWGIHDDLFLNMIKMSRYAVSLNKENRIVAFIWHQGEADVMLGSHKETYKQNLTALVKNTRKLLCYDHLPFIASDFSQQWKEKNTTACTPIIEAIMETCNETERAGFVTTDSLLSNDQMFHNGDALHFCNESFNQLGIRYFEVFHQICSRL